MWLLATIAPPVRGMFSAPSMVIFRSIARNTDSAVTMTGRYTSSAMAPG